LPPSAGEERHELAGADPGLVERTGWPVRVVRTAIEVSVAGLGWLLGGTFGVGTLLFAVAVGPLVQPPPPPPLLPLLPLLRVPGPAGDPAQHPD
jgi:hypothetical protein